MAKNAYFILAFSLITHLSIGQETLTLDQVIKAAIENNYQIKVLENQKEIAENSVSIGNAGLLPSVNLNGTYGGNVNNTELEFAGNIPPTSIDNAQSSNLAANATLSYVLFNGLSGVRSYDRLKLNKEAVDFQTRAQLESTILQVASSFYNLTQAQEQERIALQNVEISQLRYERAKLAYEMGTNLRTDLLSAQVDLTTDSTTLLVAQLQKTTALSNLRRITAQEWPETTVTEDVTVEMQDWTSDQLLRQAQENNATIKNIELQRALAEKDLQLSWASTFPRVSISGGYAFNNQQNEAGIVLSNTASGWNGSIGVSYLIFDGFRNNIARQNQRVAVESSMWQLEDQRLQLSTDIENALATYRQSVRVLAFEEQNLESSQLNLERSDELYRSGQITSAQFREAQRGLVNAEVRIANAKISAKLNELEILRLTGQILSEN